MHDFHNSRNHITPTEDAFVGHQVKTLLPPVEDYAASWLLFVLDICGNCTSTLEPFPMVNVAGRMRQRSAVGLRHGDRRCVDYEFAVVKPEDSDARLSLSRVWLTASPHAACSLFPAE
jgi:hypothetical protein